MSFARIVCFTSPRVQGRNPDHGLIEIDANAIVLHRAETGELRLHVVAAELQERCVERAVPFRDDDAFEPGVGVPDGDSDATAADVSVKRRKCVSSVSRRRVSRNSGSSPAAFP